MLSQPGEVSLDFKYFINSDKMIKSTSNFGLLEVNRGKGELQQLGLNLFKRSYYARIELTSTITCPTQMEHIHLKPFYMCCFFFSPALGKPCIAVKFSHNFFLLNIGYNLLRAIWFPLQQSTQMNTCVSLGWFFPHFGQIILVEG